MKHYLKTNNNTIKYTKKRRINNIEFNRIKLINLLKKQIKLLAPSDSFYAKGFKDCIKDIVEDLNIEELKNYIS